MKINHTYRTKAGAKYPYIVHILACNTQGVSNDYELHIADEDGITLNTYVVFFKKDDMNFEEVDNLEWSLTMMRGYYQVCEKK